jgi:hypothetical protein
MSIWTDIAQWHCAHQQRCIDLNRCVCGTYERQNADFEQRLKQAMERYPETTGFADSDGGEPD